MPNTLYRAMPFAATLSLVALLAGCTPNSPNPGPQGLDHSPQPQASHSAAPASTPAAPAVAADIRMSVPFGLYAASSYSKSIASMRMRSDGRYSMRANPYGSGIINPDEGGEVGRYEVIDAATIKFDTGAYAGLLGKLYPNYQGGTRMFIDVQLGDGTKQSYSFVNA